MFKNKEFAVYVISLSALTLFGTAGCFLFGNIAWIIMLVTGLLMIILSLLYTVWRYNKIKELSAYLKKVADGDYSFSSEDCEEGELSVLQSELYKITTTISDQASRLKKDKVFLADAIADISHQLKTPLTSISMMTDLLLQGGLSQSKNDEFIGNIQRSTDRIKWLISALLKMARLDSGYVAFKEEKVSIPTLIKSSVQPILMLMELKEQRLEIEGDNNIEINGDAYWLSEALTNIIKNCIEHTPIGGNIMISYGHNPLHTFINITDNGAGMDKADIARIFDRFYKGKNSSNESIGIGLALSKSIIQKQYGSIEVVSEKGKGTEFTVKFYNSPHKK